MDTVTILLATCNRDELLQQELESFCNLYLPDIELKILVGDNACRKETQTICEQFNTQLDITYIQQKTPGKNSTLNKLLPYAKGQYYIFTDDDIIADKNWVLELIQASKHFPTATVFAGRILPYVPKGYILPDNKMVSKFVQTGNWDQEDGPISHLKIVGANMMVKSEVFTDGVLFNASVGPNGKNYMMGSETEFILRLELHGYSAAYASKAIVHHYIRPEQFSVGWWLARMERRGRGSLLLAEPSETPRLFRAPRYLFTKALKLNLQYIWATLIGNKTKSDTFKSEYFYVLGQIKQYRLYGNSDVR